jgi:Vitamin K epoxide reductase family
MPCPDAAVGVLAYAAEVMLGIAIAAVAGAAGRLAAATYAAMVAGMEVGSLGLVAVQVLSVHHPCTLCTASAVLSWLVAGTVLPDAISTYRRSRPKRDPRVEMGRHCHGEQVPLDLRARVGRVRAPRLAGKGANVPSPDRSRLVHAGLLASWRARRAAESDRPLDDRVLRSTCRSDDLVGGSPGSGTQ